MGNTEDRIENNLPKQIAGLIGLIRGSDRRGEVAAFLLALVAIVGATAYAQTLLNAWNQPFYDALARKDGATFARQLVLFAQIAGSLLGLNVAQTWLNQRTKLALRRAIGERLIVDWLAPLIAARLSQAGQLGENPDQRIHEDVRRLTELSTDLGVGLLQSTMLLITFATILWTLSDDLLISIGGTLFAVPGYMVWCALLYSIAASALSWRVGSPLISLNEERYAAEAKLRSVLVHVNEEIESITLNGAEPEAARKLKSVFGDVVTIAKRLAMATTGLAWVTAGVGWLAIVAPILVAAPVYFAGDMTFGKLMMVVGAFNQVQTALGWFVNNFSGIADWRATLSRVVSFHEALSTIERLREGESRIEVQGGHEESFIIDDLWISTRSGHIVLNDPHLVVKAGDRVLIKGDSDDERALFLAISGLWPWGGGSIARPHRQSIVFMSSPGSIAPGPLRLSLTFPHPPDAYDDERIRAALTTVGLEHFATSIDTDDRWDHRLLDDEKQRVTMARALLVRPRWLVIHRALASVDLVSAERIAASFSREMPEVGLIYIGDAPAAPDFFTRMVDFTLERKRPPFHPTVAPRIG
ncbi:hypothetical protein CCR94_04640 [Rhodoblastus sphagnicola]|uniref:Uncharacterized protein n=1 Tax=Rhodoblastus sphagnicola TaxID=333368 RepID=A0A2S6NDL5_9HYPH|nr:ABC transporter ATP-binding protein/permease [Rhodoblastus sphagnicola]MBB4200096.1 putative ATP-binding cassette transporter [Rhodoblastus sphagnicola]PPQ32706.1 hypothetical protein CCR94_04640 [Rhodoblastus sphagnicola]